MNLETINTWANNLKGPVALHLHQKLVSVEGEGSVIFPPTYAGIGYNTDELSDGTKVATIDSVGSQANRIEPIFKEEPYSSLVPQINIEYGTKGQSTSIFDVGHRLGDAVIRCTSLREKAQLAFESFDENGDASKLAQLAPTSLVFGVWDSRDTGAKVPRIVSSVIRAWNVDILKRSAQYNPALNYSELEVFSEEDKAKEEKKGTGTLAERGFIHVPSTGDHGGVYVRGDISRDITINLVALRRLKGEGQSHSAALRRYILGLALVAATAPLDPYLRQGCLLVTDGVQANSWSLVQRNGKREEIGLTEETALDYASKVSRDFGVGSDQTLIFDKSLAKKDVSQKK